jgi:Fur family ferric uptake transcriptional regulator
MKAKTVHDRTAKAPRGRATRRGGDATALNLGASWADHARARLREEGARAGGARRAVIELLAGQDCCLSAQEIWERLRDSGERASLASVYRAVELLHELELVQRIEVGGGIARYEPALPSGDHHHHVVCDRCGRIAAFEDDGLEEAISSLASRLRHTVSAHDVVIHGECPRCAPRRSSRASA